VFESYSVYLVIDYKRLGWMRNPAALAFKFVLSSVEGVCLQLLLLEDSAFESCLGLIVGFLEDSALVGHMFE
jgi:hypothetical protein